MRTGGLSLRWFKDHVARHEGDGSYYGTLSEGAAKVPAGAGGVQFLPYLTGGYGEEKEASGCFLNMTMDDNQFVMWRAVLEAIGYDYMGLADSYRAAGVPLKRITVTEGGSRDGLWNQIKSNMLGAEVVRFENAGDLEGVDDVKAALGSVIKRSGVYKPEAALTRRYRELFENRQKLVREDLKAAFSRLVKMRAIH